MRRLLIPLFVALPAIAFGQGVLPPVAQAFDAIRPAIDRGDRCKTLICGKDALAASHAYFDGAGIRDTKGVAWSTQGTPTQVARVGRVPPGAVCSDSAYYYLAGSPSGSDVLDFAGDFWGCVIFKLGGSLPTSWTVLFDNGISGVGNGGYVVQFDGTGAGTLRFAHYNAGNGTAYGQTANAAVTSQVNVACFGRIGNTPYAKLNLGAIANASTGAFSVGSAFQAYLGRYNSTGLAFGGTLIETIFVPASPGSDSDAADALFTSVINGVHSKLGITAW